MRTKRAKRVTKRRETQLNTIRDLMVAAAAGGEWLTLSEIAEQTEFAEASISAQLRHLRKECHGGYWVEKRFRREIRPTSAAGCAACQGSVWEYRVLRPEGAAQNEQECTGHSCGSNAPEPGRDACQNA